MSAATPNVAASVRARLLNVVKAQGVDFNQVLVRFALERILYRLTQSPHADRFLLKGVLLFTLWYDMLRTSSGARSCLRIFLKIPFARDMQIRSALRCNGQRCATHQVQSASALPQTWGPARRLYHRRGLP